MATTPTAAYRGLFGLFRRAYLVVLVGALGIPDFFDRARTRSRTIIPLRSQQLERRRAGSGTGQPLIGMIERAEKQAGDKLLYFGVVLRCGRSRRSQAPSKSVQRAYQSPDARGETVGALSSLRSHTRARGDRLDSDDVIGPQLVGGIAEVVNLDDCSYVVGCCAFP